MRLNYQLILLNIQMTYMYFLTGGMRYMIFHHLSYLIQLSESSAYRFVTDGQYSINNVMIISVQSMYYSISIYLDSLELVLLNVDS